MSEKGRRAGTSGGAQWAAKGWASKTGGQDLSSLTCSGGGIEMIVRSIGGEAAEPALGPRLRLDRSGEPKLTSVPLREAAESEACSGCCAAAMMTGTATAASGQVEGARAH